MTENGNNTQQFSIRLRTLIDIIFAVIIAQSIIDYQTLLFPPQFWGLPFWALLGVYSSIIFSWYSYNNALDRNPYLSDSTYGKLRFATDFGIVVMYSFLLSAINWLEQGLMSLPPGLAGYSLNATSAFIAGYTALFILYILDDLFVQLEHRHVELREIISDLRFWKDDPPNIEHINKSMIVSSIYLIGFGTYTSIQMFNVLSHQSQQFIAIVAVLFSISLMVSWRFWLDADDL